MSDKKNDSPTFNENEQNKQTNPTGQVNLTEKEIPVDQTRTTERETPVDQTTTTKQETSRDEIRTTEKEIRADNTTVAAIEKETSKNEHQDKTDENTDIMEEITPFTESEWNNKKAKLQQQFPQLTEEDLAYEEGKHTELYNRVEARLDKTNFEVKSMIDDIK